MKKKLYLLSQSVNQNWDVYDSMVIAAKDEEHAKKISLKIGTAGKHGTWAEAKDISVECIGETSKKAGLILASFISG